MVAESGFAVGRTSVRCGECAEGIGKPFDFSMAFQPIVDVHERRIYAFEALVRGPSGESAGSVLNQVTAENRYAFDQSCRVTAISMATRLGLNASGARLSINFIPGAMYRPETCVRATIAAARRHGLAPDKVIFELTENERIVDHQHLRRIFEVYRSHDLRVALDDFGSGHSGLGLLARFQPDVIKIDMEILRGLDTDGRRRAIVASIATMARSLALDVVAEGVETARELDALRSLGLTLFQGYYFAKPGFETLPTAAL